MTRNIKKYISFICALALFLTLLPPGALALNISLESWSAIGRGLTVTRLQSLSDSRSRQMFLLDYTPGGAVSPMVVYGDKLYGKSDISFAIEYARARGHTVLAAVNADFFNLDTGLPTGMVINNGRLCSSDGAWNSVGFLPDGTAIAGAPKLSLSFSRQSTGKTQKIYAFNKIRTTAGVYLYSEDFSATTRTTANGTEVVLECAPGDYLSIGRPLTLTVVGINRTPGTPIGPNQFVLSLTDANVLGLSFGDFRVGERVTISASTENPAWANVIYSTGGGNMLAIDGTLTSSATASTTADPRTVLGVKPDGSVSVLVCDGRQKNLSDGITLLEAAQTLLARGCTNIVNLDGGGSTAISLREAGAWAPGLVSSPSDGAPRKCANYILFVNSGDSSLPASGVAIYPQSALVLAGAQLELTGLTYNDDYFATGEYRGDYILTSGGGFISGNVFYAPESSTRSMVSAAQLQGAGVSIETVANPAQLYFALEDSSAKLEALAAATNSVTDLTMYATDGMRHIISQDTQFTFSVQGNIGHIDQNGVFTAVSTPGLSGSITAAWNGMTFTLPVTVGRAPELLEDFEDSSLEFAVTPLIAGSTGTARTLVMAEDARYGKGSVSLSYSAAPPAEGAFETTRFTAKNYPIVGGGNIVSLLAKGAGDFGIDFQTPHGIERVPFAVTSDWQYITVDVPDGASAITGFSAYGEFETGGSIVIDQMMLHFGSAANDVSPPSIVNMQFDGVYLMAEVIDNYPLPVTKSMIKMTVDGEDFPFEYQPETGSVFTSFETIAGGMHRVTLVVRDYFYNQARQSIVFGQLDEYVFTDLQGHWSIEYVEYLRERGVFATAEKFNPQGLVTNEMAATIISRFLELDTSLYEWVALPYADAASISDWAVPHVKAALAEGVMVGGSRADGTRVFNPQTPSTRAQIMTVIGRTIERGFEYPPAPFYDFAGVPSWAADHISLLYSVGIVSGDTGTNLVRPTDSIKRSEIAALMFKLY